MFFRKNKKEKALCGKCFNICDVQLIKLAVFAFTLFLVNYLPQLAKKELRWIWLLVAILASIKPILKLCCPKK